MEKRPSCQIIWFCCGAVAFAASFLLLLLARKADGMAGWYAVHIYPLIVGTVGRIFGLFPFSVAEVLLYLTVIFVAAFLLRLLSRLIRGRGGRKEAAHYFSGLWLVAGVLFFLYTLNCGINYQRDSFAEGAGIKTGEYSVEELREVCELLTRDVNTYAVQVERDEAGVMRLDGTEKQEAVEAMHRLGETYAELEGYYPQPKALTGSWFLSVQSLTGIYVPFTVEANYNGDMTDYNIPFTICHELSHLRGFMQEQEANFIAYLACMETDSDAFCYSGSMLGWIKCMNVLYKEDYEGWKEVREMLVEEAEADLQANSAFWAAYDGAVAEVSEQVNDSYLKANGQADGVESYDRMVDLLVAYYRE